LILRVGQHRKTWPGGDHDSRRGKNGNGGILWRRQRMRKLGDATATVAPAISVVRAVAEPDLDFVPPKKGTQCTLF
jgi:hypothetical protein